jgi:hypothetical protein
VSHPPTSGGSGAAPNAHRRTSRSSQPSSAARARWDRGQAQAENADRGKKSAGQRSGEQPARAKVGEECVA